MSVRIRFDEALEPRKLWDRGGKNPLRFCETFPLQISKRVSFGREIWSEMLCLNRFLLQPMSETPSRLFTERYFGCDNRYIYRVSLWRFLLTFSRDVVFCVRTQKYTIWLPTEVSNTANTFFNVETMIFRPVPHRLNATDECLWRNNLEAILVERGVPKFSLFSNFWEKFAHLPFAMVPSNRWQLFWERDLNGEKEKGDCRGFLYVKALSFLNQKCPDRSFKSWH